MSQKIDVEALDRHFPRYTEYDPPVPVWCLTPGEGRCIHRFFDTTPISPSGRYAAVFRLPREDRLPEPGDAGQVVLIDLHSGEEKVVAQTRGWEAQMGANINWGGSDELLVFNDVDTSAWTPQLVRLNPLTGEAHKTPGGVYHVSPDGRFAAASSTHKMRRTQGGYGVLLPNERVPRHIGAPDDDGLFVTDLASGERKLVLPLSEAAKHIPELRDGDVDQWEVYGFHCKWSPSGERLIFTVRRMPVEKGDTFGNMKHLRFDVLTCRPDGSDVHDAVPAVRWEHGGHHINWYPGSEALSMNLGGFGEGLRLLRVDPDGADLRPIHADVLGSGHPTVHPNGTHVLTDTYIWEKQFVQDNTVPLRWIEIQSGEEREAVRIGAHVEPTPSGVLRVDPHPSWDRTWRFVTFNGVTGNTRRVFLADFQALLDG